MVPRGRCWWGLVFRIGGDAVVIVRANRGLSGVITSILARPTLVWEALRAALSVRGRQGNAQDYLAWRMVTAYGSADHPIEPRDFTEFLRWRRGMRSITRWAGST